MTVLMISIGRCTELLNKNEKKYTEQEVKQIRELLYKLANVEYELFTKLELNERNNLHKGLDR